MEENSISIINRTNGQLTGEKAQALPVKFITSLSWFKFVLIGAVISLILFLIFLFTAQSQVSVVQVTGKASNYQLLQIN